MGVQGDGARDAKPRTAPCGAAARWGHRALPLRDTRGWYVNGAQRERCARAMRAGCQAATGGGAAAKHRALPQRGTKGGVAGEGIGAVRTVGYRVFAG